MQLTTTRTNLPIYEVNDSTKFACFDYPKNNLNPIYKVGQIVAKETEGVEVGVILDTYTHRDIRTDQFGVECDSNLRPATLEEINTYRPDIIPTEQKDWTYFTLSQYFFYGLKEPKLFHEVKRSLNTPKEIKEYIDKQNSYRHESLKDYLDKVSFTSKKLKPYIENQSFADSFSC